MRIWSLRRDLYKLDNDYEDLFAKAKRDEVARSEILGEWSFEAKWPSNELAEMESERLRKLAHRWNIDTPLFDQDTETGHWLFPEDTRRRLRREIQHIRRESIGWWVRFIVLPVVGGFVGGVVSVVGLYLRYLRACE